MKYFIELPGYGTIEVEEITPQKFRLIDSSLLAICVYSWDENTKAFSDSEFSCLGVVVSVQRYDVSIYDEIGCGIDTFEGPSLDQIKEAISTMKFDDFNPDDL